MEGTIAEIRMFAGTFAPRNWAFCAGQLMSISQNTALFSILGTTYGGNGQTTFGLPDLRSRVPKGTGQGPGLTNISLGEVSGTETVTLLTTQMPAHSHTATGTLAVNQNPGTASNPVGNFLAGGQDPTANPIPTYASAAAGGNLNGLTVAVGISGNSQPVPINNPYLGMNYIICLFGIFPSRN
jgi:microcystin-dependent protein